MIGKIIHIIRVRGIVGATRAIVMRLRRLLARRAKSFQTYESLFVGKTGIEIGGPSQVFTRGGMFPVYPIAGHLDNCNFGNVTVWEGDIKQGQTFQFDRRKPAGRQYIIEATAMGCLNSGAYDFVLSSHVLEHVANPILALFEWKRLLADNGILVLLLPDRNRTFDHRRPVTTMEHLIADYKAGRAEDDLTHLPEILALHDLERDPEAGDIEAFKRRSMRNFENRCLHHHVFDAYLAASLVEYAGLKVQAVEEVYPHHILLLTQKTATVSRQRIRPFSTVAIPMSCDLGKKAPIRKQGGISKTEPVITTSQPRPC
ncbi:MAG: methyltransferase domain-containing protein [Sulfuricella sp.]